MRYLKETLDYLFVRGKGKHFIMLFLFALLPAAMMVFGMRFENFIGNIFNPPEYEKVSDVFLSYLPEKYGAISFAAGVVFSVIATAGIEGAVVRHFRVGDFNPKQILRAFNDYALPSAVYIAMKLAIYLLSLVIYALFAFMWYKVASNTAYTVLSLITLLVFVVVDIYVSAALTLWLPTMCIKGVYSHNALSSAFYASRGKQKDFIWGHIAVFAILAVTATVSYFVSKIWYVSWIIGSVGYAIAYAFILIFVMTAYFGENRLPREDIGVSPYKRRIK